MKKVVLSLVLFASVVAVSAQPRAIGGRITNGLELSYQHGFGEGNMLQGDLGLSGLGYGYGLQVTGVYNWVFPISSDSWNWYVGPGAGLGFGFGSYFYLGLAGMIGIEYNFKFPLQLSLDYRPIIPLGFGDKVGFHRAGLWNSSFGLGIRYKF